MILSSKKLNSFIAAWSLVASKVAMNNSVYPSWLISAT